MSPSVLRDDVEIDNQLQSPLLRLPGEIRNKIHGYVLDKPGKSLKLLPLDMSDPTAPCHLHYDHYNADTRERYREVNRMKYVCRLLYLETRTLGLGTTESSRVLSFPPARERNPVYTPQAAVVRFLRDCAPERIARLRYFTVHLERPLKIKYTWKEDEKQGFWRLHKKELWEEIKPLLARPGASKPGYYWESITAIGDSPMRLMQFETSSRTGGGPLR
jgi:hypothetical protein